MNVAFLANSFHLNKTKSTDFLIDLLRQWFGAVTVVPHKDAWARLPGTPWDLIVSFQKMWDPAELEAFGADRTVLVPMYDDCPKGRSSWEPYLGFRILSFSSSLGNDLRSWGHDVMTVQYWQPVPDRLSNAEPAGVDGLRGFFWPRTTGLTWAQVRLLLGQSPWSGFHLHVTNVEGGTTLPSDDERNRWNVEQTSWFDNPDDAKAAVARAHVYFAPRRYEGIGQAVLEAMALGLCVVAPNAPTMNEYIVDGQTGLLYDPENPRPLDFAHARDLGRAAREAAILGRSRWEASGPAIRDFLMAPPVRARRPRPLVALRGRSVALLRRWFRFAKRALGRG